MSGFLHSLKNITGSKHGQDTRMRFSVAPLPGDSTFTQWHDAMMMCARLPGGIPQEFRRRLWLTLSEKHLQARGVDWSHAQRFCFNEWSNPDDDELGDQIVKDLHRTGCSLFCGEEAEDNQAMLKRVLLAYARWNKGVGYCQGFNMLAAIILEVMERQESDALKVMIYLIEGVLPESYFANNLRGLSVDMAVFRDLLRLRLPHLSRHLEHLQHDAADLATGTSYEPPLTNVFTMQWFLTLFSNCLPRETVMRVWDLTFLQGNEVLLRTALAIWDGLAVRILEVHSADEFYTVMGVLTREMLTFGLMDANKLVQTVVGIAPFPFPGLAELRDKYTYNITPWTQSVSSVAKRGLRLFYSDDDDEEDNYEDDDQTIAIATAFGLSGIFRKSIESSRGPSPVSGGTASAVSPTAFPPLGFPSPRHTHDVPREISSRPNLDISALKKQYARLRERQKQAHIILTSSQLRVGVGSGGGSGQKSTPLTMNHLLRGKKALTSKTRRVVPQGVIPVIKPKKKAERKLSDSTGFRSTPQPSRGRQPMATTSSTGPVRAPHQNLKRLTSNNSEGPPKVETLHWKDTPRRDRRASLPSGVKLLEGPPTFSSGALGIPDEMDDDDGGSSTSTELCDDDDDKLSDLEPDPGTEPRPATTSPRLETVVEKGKTPATDNQQQQKPPSSDKDVSRKEEEEAKVPPTEKAAVSHTEPETQVEPVRKIIAPQEESRESVLIVAAVDAEVTVTATLPPSESQEVKETPEIILESKEKPLWTFQPSTETQTTFGIPLEDLLAGKSLTAAEIIARIPFPSDVSFMKEEAEESSTMNNNQELIDASSSDPFSTLHNVTPEKSPVDSPVPRFPSPIPEKESSLIIGPSPSISPSKSPSRSHSPSPKESPFISPEKTPAKSPSLSPVLTQGESSPPLWSLSRITPINVSDSGQDVFYTPPKSPKITLEDEKSNIFEIHSGLPPLIHTLQELEAKQSINPSESRKTSLEDAAQKAISSNSDVQNVNYPLVRDTIITLHKTTDAKSSESDKINKDAIITLPKTSDTESSENEKVIKDTTISLHKTSDGEYLENDKEIKDTVITLHKTTEAKSLEKDEIIKDAIIALHKTTGAESSEKDKIIKDTIIALQKTTEAESSEKDTVIKDTTISLNKTLDAESSEKDKVIKGSIITLHKTPDAESSENYKVIEDTIITLHKTPDPDPSENYKIIKDEATEILPQQTINLELQSSPDQESNDIFSNALSEITLPFSTPFSSTSRFSSLISELQEDKTLDKELENIDDKTEVFGTPEGFEEMQIESLFSASAILDAASVITPKIVKTDSWLSSLTLTTDSTTVPVECQSYKTLPSSPETKEPTIEVSPFITTKASFEFSVIPETVHSTLPSSPETKEPATEEFPFTTTKASYEFSVTPKTDHSTLTSSQETKKPTNQSSPFITTKASYEIYEIPEMVYSKSIISDDLIKDVSLLASSNSSICSAMTTTTDSETKISSAPLDSSSVIKSTAVTYAGFSSLAQDNTKDIVNEDGSQYSTSVLMKSNVIQTDTSVEPVWTNYLDRVSDVTISDSQKHLPEAPQKMETFEPSSPSMRDKLANSGEISLSIEEKSLAFLEQDRNIPVTENFKESSPKHSPPNVASVHTPEEELQTIVSVHETSNTTLFTHSELTKPDFSSDNVFSFLSTEIKSTLPTTTAGTESVGLSSFDISKTLPSSTKIIEVHSHSLDDISEALSSRKSKFFSTFSETISSTDTIELNKQLSLDTSGISLSDKTIRTTMEEQSQSPVDFKETLLSLDASGMSLTDKTIEITTEEQNQSPVDFKETLLSFKSKVASTEIAPSSPGEFKPNLLPFNSAVVSTVTDAPSPVDIKETLLSSNTSIATIETDNKAPVEATRSSYETEMPYTGTVNVPSLDIKETLLSTNTSIATTETDSKAPVDITRSSYETGMPYTGAVNVPSLDIKESLLSSNTSIAITETDSKAPVDVTRSSYETGMPYTRTVNVPSLDINETLLSYKSDTATTRIKSPSPTDINKSLCDNTTPITSVCAPLACISETIPRIEEISEQSSDTSEAVLPYPTTTSTTDRVIQLPADISDTIISTTTKLFSDLSLEVTQESDVSSKAFAIESEKLCVAEDQKSSPIESEEKDNLFASCLCLTTAASKISASLLGDENEEKVTVKRCALEDRTPSPLKNGKKSPSLDSSIERPSPAVTPRDGESLSTSLEGRLSSLATSSSIELKDDVFAGACSQEEKDNDKKLEEYETDIFNGKDLSSEAIRQRLWRGVKSLSLDADVTLDPDVFCFLIQQCSRTAGKSDGGKRLMGKRRNSEVELQELVKENTEIIERILKQKSLEDSRIYCIKESEQTDSSGCSEDPNSKERKRTLRFFSSSAETSQGTSRDHLASFQLSKTVSSELSSGMTNSSSSHEKGSVASSKSGISSPSKSSRYSSSFAEPKLNYTGNENEISVKSCGITKSFTKPSKLSRSSSVTLENPMRPITFNPFPTRNLNKPPKDVAVKLGLYSPNKSSGSSPT